MDKSKKSARHKIKSWYSNRYQIVVVQRNILLLFTAVSVVSVAIAVIFVKNIVSSKSLEPYVIEVEDKSGIPTVVSQKTVQEFSGDEMVKKYFINQYVQAATGYDPRTYKMDADKIRLFSTPQVFNEFKNRINPNLLGVDSKIEVRIKSIQFMDSANAQIRIARQILEQGKASSKDELVIMSFYFASLTLSSEERLINPLGFQVSRYQVTEEIFKY